MCEDDRIVGFEVSDNGCGMDEEIKGHLFRSFFTTKEGRGTGLGLLNTQKIVKQHGGTIAVDSEPAKGSTFTIRLPFRDVATGEAIAKES
jgi:signal transduction histidine kinase